MGSDTNEAQPLEEGEPESPRYFERQSRCFPFEPFKLLPGHVKIFIPGTLQKIQDWTHFVLVFGVVACTALVFQTIYSLTYGRCDRDGYCIKEALAIFFIAPCTIYCFRIIGQYDDRLQAKQKQAKQEKENMKKTYNALLSEMDGLLGKAAESSTGLAERSFESKRRDFQRFLERAKTKFQQFTGSPAEQDKLLKQFRRFCVNWLNVFAECSIDPINCPKRVVNMEELDKCTSIDEVAELCLQRLRVTEVRFISIQRDQDAQMLRKNRNDFKRLTAWPGGARSRNQALTDGGPMTHVMQSGVTRLSPEVRSVGSKFKVSWISCGRTGCKIVKTTNNSSDGFPKEIHCICGHLIMLSCEHATLMAGFIVGWVMIMLDVWAFQQMYRERPSQAPFPLSIFEILIAQVCLAVMLYRFEDIDTIQQLNREVRELAKQNKHVEQQREKMREFWSNAQQLTELWLYRTVPRLDLYKELHSQLEDTPQEDILLNLTGANHNLENLDEKLGNLEDWRNDGDFKLESKKAFGKKINMLCQEQSFDDMLGKLDEINVSNMMCLEDNERASPR